MKQSVKRIISSVIALVALVAALVIFFSFVVPLYADIATIRGEEASRKSLLEDQKKIVAQVKALISTYQKGARVQDLVSSALPLNQNVADALLQLNGISQANRLTPSVFVVMPAPVATAARNDVTKNNLVKDVGSYTIRVDVAGSYEDFKAFLRNIESNIRIFDVKNITLQPAGKTNPGGFLYSVTIVAYYQNS